MCLRFDSRTRRQMWIEFVVGSLPCTERFFSGYSGFPLSSKTNISTLQFDLDYCQALYHESLACVIVQALPVFDIKFAFTFFYMHKAAVISALHGSKFSPKNKLMYKISDANSSIKCI